MAVTVEDRIADAARDAVGNGSEASPEFSLVVDSTGPEVVLTSFETPRESNSRTIRIHAVFNEPVFDFDRSDIVVHGGTVLNFTGRDDRVTYLFDIRPEAGTLRVELPGGAARDAIGNLSKAAEPLLRQIDRTRPSVELEFHPDQVPPGQPVPLTITFSEPVYGFEPGDLKVSRGTAHRTGGDSDDQVYQYLVAPSGTRRVEAQVPSGVATDLAGNKNRGASARFQPRPPASTNATEPGAAAPPLD